MKSLDQLPVTSGWVPIRDARSNGGEPVIAAVINLRTVSGLGVHVEGERRVLRARFPDGSERTLDADYADDEEATQALRAIVLLVSGHAG
jgi:hypothetical protein